MTDATLVYVVWALVLGGVSAVSLPLGSLVGLHVKFQSRYIAIFATGALIAALSVEFVAPTAFALTEPPHAAGSEHAHAHFFAMLGGGVLGGLVFVALDAVVNTKGGYLRKTSTTLAYVAKRRRASVQKVMGAVLKVNPFDVLPGDMGQMLGSMLSPVDFGRGELISSPDIEPAAVYIVLEGEVDIDISGKHGGSFGPGNLIGVGMLFAPALIAVCTIRAKNDLKCLALAREDVDQLRSLSADFDQACRHLAAQRMGLIEQHLVTQLNEAV